MRWSMRVPSFIRAGQKPLGGETRLNPAGPVLALRAASSAQLYRSNASEGRSSTARTQQNSTVSSCARTGLISGLARRCRSLRDDLSFFFHFIDDPFGAHGNFSLIAVATSVTAGSCRFSGWSSKYCKAISTNCPTVTPAGIQLG